VITRVACVALVAALAGVGSAEAQTRTSTGVEFESRRLDAELGDWESGARPLDDASTPAGPGAPRVGPGQAPREAPPPPPPRYAPSPSPRVDTAVDTNLVAQGEEQRATGRIFLFSGIGAAAVGSAMGIAGYARAVSNPTNNNGGNALLILGGIAVGGAGAAGIVVGSVMMHRGGKKIDRARRSTAITSVAPTLIDGHTPALVIGGVYDLK